MGDSLAVRPLGEVGRPGGPALPGFRRLPPMGVSWAVRRRGGSGPARRSSPTFLEMVGTDC